MIATMNRTKTPRPVQGPTEEGHHVHPAWPKMLSVKRQRPDLCVSYPNDFWIHDANAVSKANPREPFWWLIYPGGSHLYFVMGKYGHGPGNACTALLRQCVRDYAHGDVGSPTGAFLGFWDGSTLQEVTPERCEVLIEEHRRRLRDTCSECGVAQNLHTNPEPWHIFARRNA